MLSSVLNSDNAVEMNIAIMRAFVRLREVLSSHKDIARKLDDHEQQIAYLFQLVEKLRSPLTSKQKKRKIGFIRDLEEK